MKYPIYYTALLFIVFGMQLKAQPFSLDEKIKPVKLELIDDVKVKDAKGIITNATIDKDSHYWFTKVDMFQPVDVFVFSNYGDADFKVDIANANWKDVVESQTTGESQDGIVHFKIKTEGDFGIQVHPTNKKVNYTLVVYANPPVKEYLGSAFRKARPDELKTAETDTTSQKESGGEGNSNTLLYILLGFALLVIGFLLAKVLTKKKTIGIFILFVLGTAQLGFSQQHSGNVWGPSNQQQYEDWLRDRAAEDSGSGWDDAKKIGDGLGRMGQVGDKVLKGLGTYGAAKDAYEAYKGLSSCLNSTPPPNMPKIPSFCVTDECASCFLDARQRFNDNRYSFERLKTIYTCTKNYTDRMISFGDNVSGYHGISGLAWQTQKIEVEKSINSLKKTYDNKYVELLQKQQDILQELNECEAAHGIPDWYDRFGYMYFEFTQMNYARQN